MHKFKVWYRSQNPEVRNVGEWPIRQYYRFLGNERIIEELEELRRTYNDGWADYIKKRKIINRLSIGFMRQLFDLSMEAAANLMERFAAESRSRDDEVKHEGNEIKLAAMLKVLHDKGIARISEFVDAVATEEKARVFSAETKIPMDDIWFAVQWTDWRIIPEQKHLGLVLDRNDRASKEYAARLASRKLANNLALLEASRSMANRTRLADELSIPLNNLTDIVHRADMSRKMAQ